MNHLVQVKNIGVPMNSFLKTTVSIAIAFSLSACAGTAPEAKKSVDEILAEKNLRIAEPVKQLINFNIRGWQYVNLQNVVLQDGPSKIYLVELNAPCRNLDYAQEIAFTSFGRVISKNEKLIVTDGPGHAQNCFMKAFYLLEKIDK